MNGFEDKGESKEAKENSKTNQLTKEQIIQQAFNFHAKGNISKARKYYQYLISQGLKDYRVFSNYGVILKGLRNLQEAELLLRKAIAIKPDFPEAHYNLGNTLTDLGELQEAELSLRQAIELKPNYAKAHSNLGIVFRSLGKLQEAELSTRKAIELKPDFSQAHYNLGNILRDFGNLQDAEISTRKAIELNPCLTEAHINLGNILREIGNLHEAESSLRKAIEIKPDNAIAHSNLGSLLKELGKGEEAINNMIRAVQLNPNSNKIVKNLAIDLCYAEKYELALKYLSRNKSNSCQSLYLGCLLSLDREKDFNQKYQELYKNKVCNADLGGIVEHANIIYERKYESPFCNEAIEYILIDKINAESFSENHLNQLIAYAKNDTTRMKSQGTLKGGVQTSGNLFTLDLPFIKSIKKALEEKIDLYKNNFKDSGQAFIKYWPKNYELRSWIISMKTGGFLAPHNHEYGWITGSFYLQVPKRYDNDEAGNIAFSYQGPRYPSKKKDFNLTIKKIETRDICIFPSSLFHHTIPFQSNEDRICFVFDLVEK